MMTSLNTKGSIVKPAVLTVSSLCAKVFSTVFSEAQWSSMHTHPMCQKIGGDNCCLKQASPTLVEGNLEKVIINLWMSTQDTESFFLYIIFLWHINESKYALCIVHFSAYELIIIINFVVFIPRKVTLLSPSLCKSLVISGTLLTYTEN